MSCSYPLALYLAVACVVSRQQSSDVCPCSQHDLYSRMFANETKRSASLGYLLPAPISKAQTRWSATRTRGRNVHSGRRSLSPSHMSGYRCLYPLISSHLLNPPPITPNISTSDLSITPPHIEAHHTVSFRILKHKLLPADTASSAPRSIDHHHPARDNQPRYRIR